jgi:hypothetical protein
MRAPIVLALLTIAGPVAVQPYLGLAQVRDGQLWADVQAARNRDVALANELAALQARAQSEQAVSHLQAQRVSPALPSPAVSDAAARLPVIDTSKLASIPDAALAQSNARVLAAAANRR